MSARTAAMWGGLAAASLLIGAALELRLALSNRLIGAVMGFGAGTLISSISYELVPASEVAGTGQLTLLAFAAGAVVFFAADWVIDHTGGSTRKSIAGRQDDGTGTAIFLGTLLDGVPESLVWESVSRPAGRSASPSSARCSSPTRPRASPERGP